ncbi:MAG: hypothetical protein KG012_14715 [Deltaproteobacteria bacterium]|jgi:hypothetical protein|nr:hypothetical protein [Deltaproteobacteria bacterium]
MPTQDEWGHDPTVQMMRRIFSLMENSQKDLLRDLNISLFDPRLRRARSRARDLFEQTWPLAMQKEIVSNERGATLLYMHCLAHTLSLNGIEVPEQVSSKDERIAMFLRKELR